MDPDALALLTVTTEMLFVAVIVYLIARLLIRAVNESRLPHQPVITAMGILGIIGIIALLGGIFTTHESAYTIAAAVAGGIATYLASKARDATGEQDVAVGPPAGPTDVIPPDDRDLTPEWDEDVAEGNQRGHG